jgi:hypothetical protein
VFSLPCVDARQRLCRVFLALCRPRTATIVFPVVTETYRTATLCSHQSRKDKRKIAPPSLESYLRALLFLQRWPWLPSGRVPLALWLQLLPSICVREAGRLAVSCCLRCREGTPAL